MKIELNPGEVLEDLQRDGLSIVQNSGLYKFSADSVLLSDFARVAKRDNVVELCSGSGIVSVLVFAKYHPKKIVGIESDKMLFDMSQKTLQINTLQGIEFMLDDLKNAPKLLGREVADVVICNPPYYVLPAETKNISQKYLTTKYESTATLCDILKTASTILKFGGKCYFVYTTSRIQELLFEAKNNNLICKTLKFVFNKDISNTVLVKFIKKGNAETIVEKIDN